MLLEVLFSVLLAPVRMLFHTVFVVSAFLGWEVVWNSPQRDDDSTSWGEAFKRHGSQLLLGLVWAVGMAWLDLRFLFWLAPIVFSLILSPFVSVISSRATVGLRTKRWKLFLIPEEYSPPQVLVDTDRFLEMNRQRSLDDGFMHAVFNPSQPAARRRRPYLTLWQPQWRPRVTAPARCWKSPVTATLNRR
ncbi:hypothetical protein EIMP300_61990 [Escherichia coli]|uniref:Glucosyltransferase MdoH n=1 Tax=Escherichia coli TaxID=562 RepID=A0A8S0FXU0_ECOLX|nr:hypothetical protein EIMP300_61990 [Escherichia coli]